MSRFEQSIAKFLSGDATSDDLRTSLELMAPLDDDDVKYVSTTLNNLAATGQLDPKVHKELLNTAITRSTRTGVHDQAGNAPQSLNEPAITDETLFSPGSTNGIHDIADKNQAQLSINPTNQPDTDGEHRGPELAQSRANIEGLSQSQSNIPAFDSGNRQSSRYDPAAKSGGISNWTTASRPTGMRTQAPAEGTVIKDRFVLEKKIAKGGMGIVFKARDLVKEEVHERNPYVALKILNETFKNHPASFQALSREARKTQNLAHPNIVNVFDFDRDYDTVFMTMELLEGKGLDQVLKESDGHGLPIAQALDYISQMSRGLAHAHSKGVLHCDFKPNNVFLLNDGTVKVLDFGIARANRQFEEEEPADQTRFDAKVLGAMTVGYASREIHENLEPETSDDVFALACVSYELLTGKHPYGNKAANTLLEGPEKLKRPSALKRNQWKALQKGLAIQRIHRTGTVSEFIDGLNPDGRIAVNSKQIAAVIGAASIIGLAFYIPWQLERNQMARLADALDSQDSAIAIEAIQIIESFDNSDRESLPSSVQSGVIDFLNSQAQLAEDPTEAEEFLKRGLQLFPTSATLFATQQAIEAEKNQRISDLNTDFAYALENSLITEVSGPGNIEELLRNVELEDPQSPLLTDRRLVLRIQQQAQLAVQNGEFDSAVSLVTFGLQRFPNDPGLIDMPNIIEQARGNFIATIESERRAVETLDQDRERLDELIGNSEFTTAWDNEVNQLLNSLLISRVLTGEEFEAISEQIGELYVSESNVAINSERFTEAFRLINSGKGYAPELDWSGQEILLADAQVEQLRTYEIEGLKYTFQTQISAMQLASARESLTKLQELAVDATDPFMSQAFVDLAERSAPNDGLQQALDYSSEGLMFNPDSAELASLQNSLRLQIARQAIYTYFVEQAGNEEDTRQLLVEASELAPSSNDHDNFIRSMDTDLSETLTKLDQVEAEVLLASIKTLLPQLGDSLDSFAEPGPEQRIETLVSTAQNYLNEGIFDSAIENYQLAMQIDASHLLVRELSVDISDAIFSEADELFDDAQYQEAINLIDTGIALEPSNLRSLERLKEDSQDELEAPRRSPRAIGF